MKEKSRKIQRGQEKRVLRMKVIDSAQYCRTVKSNKVREGSRRFGKVEVTGDLDRRRLVRAIAESLLEWLTCEWTIRG